MGCRTEFIRLKGGTVTMEVSNYAMPHRARSHATKISWQFCAVALLCLASCDRAPSQNVVGSFFPSWILCLGAGITIAAASRVILVAVRFDKYVFAPPLAYLAVAVAATVFTWLYRFGQ